MERSRTPGRRCASGAAWQAQGGSGTDGAMGRAGVTKGRKAAEAVEAEKQATAEKTPADGEVAVLSGPWVPNVRQAIREELTKPECKKIAEALVKGAEEGKVAAFRMLLHMELMEPDAEAGDGCGYSQAREWLNEAEWAEGEAAGGA